MTKSALILSTVALIAGLGAVQSVQAKPARHAVVGELASKAQLEREHARAVKAGDTANDPYSSASSDALNQQQLAQAQAVMGANAAGAAEVQPGSINGSANTSGVDATGTGNSSSSVNGSLTGSVTGETGTAAGNNSNAMPPQSPPVNGTTSDSQNTPQSGATSPSSPQ